MCVDYSSVLMYLYYGNRAGNQVLRLAASELIWLK